MSNDRRGANIRYHMQNSSTVLADVLDDYRGSKAVEYVLEELIANGNMQTIQSVLDLLRRTK